MRRSSALVLLSLLLRVGAAYGQEGKVPLPHLGVLAPTVDSALTVHPTATCYHLPLATQTGQLQWKMNGCHLFAGDTLFYFYVGDDGRVWAWGRNWHVPDSTRSTTLRAIAGGYASLLGPAICTPTLERVEGFRVWQRAGYFVYAFSDREARNLGLAQNIYVGARVGSPSCSFRDHVSPPFRR